MIAYLITSFVIAYLTTAFVIAIQIKLYVTAYLITLFVIVYLNPSLLIVYLIKLSMLPNWITFVFEYFNVKLFIANLITPFLITRILLKIMTKVSNLKSLLTLCVDLYTTARLPTPENNCLPVCIKPAWQYIYSNRGAGIVATDQMSLYGR